MASVRSERRRREGRRRLVRRAYLRAGGYGSLAGLGATAAASAGFNEPPNAVQWASLGLASVIAALLGWQNEMRAPPPTIKKLSGDASYPQTASI